MKTWILGTLALLGPLAFVYCILSRSSDSAAPPFESTGYGPEAERYEEEIAEVSREGDTVFYNGGIDPESYQKFMATVRGKEDAITTIVINSPGGDIIEGMLMGEWIYANQVDVIVDTLCFSSCANYVFTAGRKKIINENSIVGWHGSAQQEVYIAENSGREMEELLREQAVMILEDIGETRITESQIEEEVKMLKMQSAEEIATEKRFLDKIGVAVDALVYGFTASQLAEYSRMESQGWTLSIADMEKLGIREVTYRGPGTYPDQGSIRAFDIVVLEVD